MSTFRKVFVGLLALLLTMSSSALADAQHIVDAGQLAATLAQRAAEQDQDRASVREALGHSEVREVAARLGADLDRLTASIETLDGSDLERAASAARRVNERLVGGASTITISTTTIIIVLLLLIVLILALK